MWPCHRSPGRPHHPRQRHAGAMAGLRRECTARHAVHRSADGRWTHPLRNPFRATAADGRRSQRRHGGSGRPPTELGCRCSSPRTSKRTHDAEAANCSGSPRWMPPTAVPTKGNCWRPASWRRRSKDGSGSSPIRCDDHCFHRCSRRLPAWRRPTITTRHRLTRWAATSTTCSRCRARHGASSSAT